MEKRYEDKHGHYTIIAMFEGDSVRFSREIEQQQLADEDVVSKEEFEKMIESEEWREIST